jgi:hypothetical protein
MPLARRTRLAQHLVQRVFLISVTTPDPEAAYRIFSILNNRGLDLTVADLLKAEIIGVIPARLQQTYTERWEGLEERLGSQSFSDFFSHLTAMYHMSSAHTTVLEGFRRHLAPVATDAQHLVDDTSLPFGAAYHMVSRAPYEHERTDLAQRVNDLLRWLNDIDNGDWIPPAISYMARYHQQPERLAPCLTKLECLAASLMIRRQYRHRRMPPMPRRCKREKVAMISQDRHRHFISQLMSAKIPSMRSTATSISCKRRLETTSCADWTAA